MNYPGFRRSTRFWMSHASIHRQTSTLAWVSSFGLPARTRGPAGTQDGLGGPVRPRVLSGGIMFEPPRQERGGAGTPAKRYPESSRSSAVRGAANLPLVKGSRAMSG